MIIVRVRSLDATLAEQFLEIIEHASQSLLHQVNPSAKSLEVTF